jgi:hypothetical protein
MYARRRSWFEQFEKPGTMRRQRQGSGEVKADRPALLHTDQETLLLQINLRHDAPMTPSFLSQYWMQHRSRTLNAL